MAIAARFLALSRRQRGILLASFFVVPLSALALRAAGIGRVRAWLDRAFAASHGVPECAPRDIARVVDAAANRLVPHPSCLTRSVATTWLLRRAGFDATLRIGVRVGERDLEAHAWVHCDGAPVNDTADVAERYAAFMDPASPPR